jgi:hypothetical protein
MSDETTKHRTADGSPLTPSEIARLDEIEARLEDSDEIPETSDGAWATAVRGKHSAAMQRRTSDPLPLTAGARWKKKSYANVEASIVTTRAR